MTNTDEPLPPSQVVVPANPGLWLLRAAGGLIFLGLAIAFRNEPGWPTEVILFAVVPLLSFACLINLGMATVRSPRLQINAAGVYANPPGAFMAWGDVASVRSRVFYMYLNTFPSLVFELKPNAVLRWDEDGMARVMKWIWAWYTRRGRFELNLKNFGEQPEVIADAVRAHSGREISGPPISR